MSDLISTQLEILTAHLIEYYFIEKDDNLIFSYMSDCVTYFDLNKDKIYKNKSDIIDLYKNQIPIFDKYQLMESLQGGECIYADGESLIVILKLKVKSYRDGSQKTLYLSFFWKNTKHKFWKISCIYQYEMINESKELQGLVIHGVETKVNDLEAFLESAAKLIDSKKNRYAIIAFEISNLYYINIRFGCQSGDMILHEIEKSLDISCDQNETFGRDSKNTFMMLLEYEGKNHMQKRIDSIIKQVTDSCILNGPDIFISLITGVYIIPNESKEHINIILNKALLAMQSGDQQQTKKNCFYYKNRILENQYTNFKIIESIPAAFQNKEFHLYIQPQFDVKYGKVIAGEALCRWEKGNGIKIPPDEFIPLLENNKLIQKFDYYMLEKLCQKMFEWIQNEKQIIPISVNQSRLHIVDENYIKNFCNIVDRYNIPHHYIVFELTESAFIDQNEKLTELAKELHVRGFQIAIDDFGTGYASLNLLSLIDADILKVDKSLVYGIHTKRGRAVLKKVIELAHEIDMKVICEGIENMEQLDQLRKINCDAAQGFLMGKPVSASEFEKIWIKRKSDKICCK